MPKPCDSGPLAAIFHTHDEWTGMCGCGAGPFAKAEWRHHYLAATASVGETVCDLDRGSTS
jgi:hypothetical protein